MCIRDSLHCPTYSSVQSEKREPSVIKTHPQSQYRKDGDEVTLAVFAEGPVHYNWMKDEEAITDDNLPNCNGANTPTLHISSLSPDYHEGMYKCVVNFEDASIASETANLKGTGVHGSAVS